MILLFSKILTLFQKIFFTSLEEYNSSSSEMLAEVKKMGNSTLSTTFLSKIISATLIQNNFCFLFKKSGILESSFRCVTIVNGFL